MSTMIDEWNSLTLTWKDLDPLIEEERTKPLVMPETYHEVKLRFPNGQYYYMRSGTTHDLEAIMDELGIKYHVAEDMRRKNPIRIDPRSKYSYDQHEWKPDPPKIEAEDYEHLRRNKKHYPDQPKNDAEAIERQRAYEQAMREQMEYVKRYAEAKLPKPEP